MGDDDFVALIALTERWLREVGAAEIADPALYTRLDIETGERRELQPQEHLVEMLLAFRRHMKVRDRGTYAAALERINQTLEDGRIEAAIIVPAGRDETRANVVRLGDAPPLAGALERLEALIRALKEDYRPDGEAAR